MSLTNLRGRRDENPRVAKFSLTQCSQDLETFQGEKGESETQKTARGGKKRKEMNVRG